MCGIFGAITNSDKLNRKPVDLGALRALALVNRERGKEALGFFDSTESIFKKADDPMDVLGTGECTEWMDRAEDEAWFIVGHTRYGTRGANIDDNSHPFQYGHVIGAHNGIIDAPNNYTVDSEYAIDMLNQAKSDYQKALEDDWGYWTLAWYDNRLGELFVSMYDNTCGIAKYKGVWYFSSDPDHLATALGVRDTIVLKNGQTVSFDSKGRMKYRRKFQSNINYSYKKDRRTSGNYYGGGYSGYTAGTTGTTGTTASSNPGGWPETRWNGNSESSSINDPDNFIKDYDDEFRRLWDEYAHEYDAM